MNPTLLISLIKKPIFLFSLGAVVAVALLGIIFATTLSKPQAPDSYTLTVWGLEDETLYQKTFERFVTANPKVKITYKQQRPDRYLDRIKARTRTNEDAEVADIFLLHNTWVPMLKDVLEPLPTALMPHETYKRLFYQSAIDSLTFNGAVVGVPVSADGLALYINESMLAAKSLAPPTEWEAFLRVATRLTVKDAQTMQTAGAAIGSAKNISYFSDIIGLMFVQQEMPIGKLSEDADANSIIEYYTRFAKGNDRVWDTSFENDIDSFARGQVAMLFGPATVAAQIKAKNPNLRFKTVPVPQLRPDEPANWATYWAWGVSKYAINRTAAWKLVLDMSSQAALVRANQRRSSLTGFALPYPRQDMAQRQASDPVLGAYIAQAINARSLPTASQTNDDDLNDTIVAALNEAITKIVAGNGTDGAVADVKPRIHEVLTKYGIE